MHSFILADNRQTLSTTGIDTVWPDVDQAIQGLQAGAPIIVGALPFHPADSPALFTPETHRFSPHPPSLPTAALPRIQKTEEYPPRGHHARRVNRAVARIRSGEFNKIVLSREVRYHLAKRCSPEALLNRFLDGSGTGHGHLVDLGPASPAHRGAVLVGSSPELLVAKQGSYIVSHPLAGTVPRSPDPVQNQARATELLHSAKNIAEHAFVTAEIRRVLAPYCTDLDIPDRPELTSTSHTWHLGTRIEARLKDPRVSVLELAAALHPTPAVCGFPTPVTQQALGMTEPDRGFYAGTVGWSDDQGNGEWRVSIRSAVTQGRIVRAHAGGGIVADSEAVDEVRETVAKLGPIRNALGLNPQVSGFPAVPAGEPAVAAPLILS